MDKYGNELQRDIVIFYSIKEARKFASILFANSNLADLHKIIVNRLYE